VHRKIDYPGWIHFFPLNKGVIVYQDSAGKKIMGIASPGKSSGYSISSGSDIEIGMIMSAKDKMVKRKLNVISPFFFNQSTNAQFKKAAIMQ
jgi:hypothetical protein